MRVPNSATVIGGAISAVLRWSAWRSRSSDKTVRRIRTIHSTARCEEERSLGGGISELQRGDHSLGEETEQRVRW